MAVRIAKIVLVLAAAFLGLTGIFNLLNYEMTMASVLAVTSMSGLPDGQTMPWASDNTVLVVLGFLFIAGGKLGGGILCLMGAWRMWTARGASAESFNAAKSFALVGCAVLLVLFFGGFMYLANQFFMAWRAEFGAASAMGAFQLGGSVALILLFVNQPDR